MEKTIRILAILLGVQLLLALGMSFNGPNLAAVHPNTPLIALGDQTVDHVTIEGSDGARVVLVKQDKGWVLPDEEGFPADGGQIDTLVSQFKELNRGLPVATTSGALKRFKVSDDGFERRVILAHGDDKLATVYLGSSQDMRHVHARTGKDDAVYAVEFAVYQAPDKTESWEDKSILQFPEDTLASIEVAGLTLNRTPSAATNKPSASGGKVDKPAGKATWQIDGLNKGEVVNETGAGDLAGKLAQLRIGAVLGTKARPEYGSDKPALTMKLTRKDGKTLEYQLGPTGKDQYVVLKTSARPEYFRVPSYSADGLIEAAGRAKLVQGAPAPAAAAASTPAAKPSESGGTPPDAGQGGSSNDSAKPGGVAHHQDDDKGGAS